MALSVGDRLGRFQIRGHLGSGGMGEVFRAWDEVLHREVAIKVLPDDVASDPVRRARFEREARSVARLSHPNILAIHDFGDDGEVAFAVTELLDGENLRERLRKGPMDWRHAVRMVSAVADGLAAAHREGVVHRDIKPSNLFATSDGQVKILDFGIARVSKGRARTSTAVTGEDTLTQEGAVPGTVGYMSPEQIKGQDPAPASDIFSLGCVLFELVAGRRAFQRDSAPETMAAILNEEPPDLSSTGVTLPGDLERVIERCLEKRPEARFQSAADLAFNLREIGIGPASAATASARVSAEKRRWWPAAAVAALALVSVVAWYGLRSRDEGSVRAPASLPAASAGLIDEWRVAVEPLENRTGDPALDAFGRTLADRFIEGLARIHHGLRVSPLTVMAAGTRSDDTIPRVDESGRAVGRLLVTGSYSRRDAALEVLVQVRDADANQVLYATRPFDMSRDAGDAESSPLLEELMGAVAIHATLGLGNVSHVPDFSHFKKFVTYVDRNASAAKEPSADPEEGREIMEVIEEDPEFLMPVFAAALAHLHIRPEEAPKYVEHIRKRWQRLTRYESRTLAMYEAWLERAWGRALEAARELQQIRPRDPEVRYCRARFAAELGEYEEAVEVLEGADELLPPHHRWPRLWDARLLSWVYFQLDRNEDALALARGLRVDMPGETDLFVIEVQALAAMARLDELAAAVAACRQLPSAQCDIDMVRCAGCWSLVAYGHREAGRAWALELVDEYRARVAEEGIASDTAIYLLAAYRAAEMWQEYGDLARQRLEQFAPPDINFAYALSSLGMASAHLGDRAGAEAILDQLEASGADSLAAYVAAHLGELDRAVDDLKRDEYWKWQPDMYRFRRWDIDFEPLRGYPPFEQFINPKG